ncbi:PREDICTED: uncharacterized protein LOC109230219 [Nicotiana attenuata]|uniref:uncharacterized protein LOC109230219 n=1 Tax=Nicotiana attenuata TaxID=49451 RepID=UPI00090580E8|nr:PREDICTED: uncharacterized protein LOC109230219 [Nicotiana attenuata]
MQWFRDSDRNTKYFHAQVRGKRKRPLLSRILDNNGNWLDSQKDMAREAVEFFQAQFIEDRVPTNFDIIQYVPKLVSIEHNELLWQEPTMEEVKATVFGLNGDSASGPDGFTGHFYQASWDIIGEDLLHMDGFVKGRSIVENILLTQEITTDIRMRGKPANVVIKLDMAKAYNRVSWLFLTKVLRQMGFGQWILQIYKGVKQGDPLSPTLFILAAEVLGRALDALLNNPDFIGFGMPKWIHNINYLSYAESYSILLTMEQSNLS